MHLLYDHIAPLCADRAEEEEQPAAPEPRAGDGEAAEAAVDRRPLMLAVVGRPNVGKSTLVNALLGEERLLTGPEAGIPRHEIAGSWTYRDQAVSPVTQAELRRQDRVHEKLEQPSG